MDIKRTRARNLPEVPACCCFLLLRYVSIRETIKDVIMGTFFDPEFLEQYAIPYYSPFYEYNMARPLPLPCAWSTNSPSHRTLAV